MQYCYRPEQYVWHLGMVDIPTRPRLRHQLNAIDHLGVSGGITAEDRELTTSASVDELSVTYSGVVNDSRCLDILAGALARLVIGREPPRVDFAVLGKGKAVVCAGGYGDDERQA